MVKNRLLEIRLKLGYKKQKDFAEYLSLRQPQYNRYENNIAQPSIEQLFQIANKLEININDIVYWIEE